MGADVRFREHYGYNWTGLNDDKVDAKGNDARTFISRDTAAAGGQNPSLMKIHTINTRVTWEFRTWDEPASKTQQRTSTK